MICDNLFCTGAAVHGRSLPKEEAAQLRIHRGRGETRPGGKNNIIRLSENLTHNTFCSRIVEPDPHRIRIHWICGSGLNQSGSTKVKFVVAKKMHFFKFV
jgi:hypothetical protein